MNKSKISWTDVTWNPTHGCSRVSEGCRNCYAERLSLQKGFTQKPWTDRNAKENVLLKRHKLRDPYRLKAPSRIFVNSMSDLFHPAIPDDYIAQIFTVMKDLPQHIFQVLTKRPDRATEWKDVWTRNIWMGTSVEDRKNLHRLNIMRECQATTRFISFEPLIEDIGSPDLNGFDWAIVGGESGKGFRLMPHAWARRIKDACLRDRVAFFFKQSAAYRTELGTSLRHDDGEFFTWHQFPSNHSEPLKSEIHRYAYE